MNPMGAGGDFGAILNTSTEAKKVTAKLTIDWYMGEEKDIAKSRKLATTTHEISAPIRRQLPATGPSRL